MLTHAYYHAGRLAAHLQQRRPFGKSIFSAEWDICIVLDSTRVDMLRTAWPTAAEIPAVWSRGSITTEWLANTFRPAQRDAIADTAYVTASPHSQTVFDDGEWLTNSDAVSVSYPDAPVVAAKAFDGFHELWRTHATEHGAVPPETMLDATLEAADRYDRVVAHWLQPHEPFIGSKRGPVGGSPTETNVWDALNNGELDPNRVWSSYMANLNYALAGVDILLDNVDATVLITSDHGNAFGDWGIYGHPFAWPHPSVRKVPWLETTATDTGQYQYESVLEDAKAETPVAEQLRALGYR